MLLLVSVRYLENIFYLLPHLATEVIQSCLRRAINNVDEVSNIN